MAALPPGAIVYGYIRVSGDAQADRGLPVAGQREAIVAYCNNNGLRLAHLYIDEARSGGNDDRAAFQDMMAAAHQSPPPVQGIVLWSWSRFARDQNDAHYWKASLRRHSVEVIDVSGEVPAVEGFEYVLESLIHWRDEQRRIEISHDARRGQQLLAQMGYIPSGCQPPRGYRVEFVEQVIEGRQRRLRRWAPDPETWATARRAWELRIAGASLKTILKETQLYRSVGCFSTFFRNSAYKGEVRFGGTIVHIEPLVTAEEWARVNANRGQRRGGAYPRRKGGRFVLSGLLRCGLCGAAMNGGHSPAGMRSDGWERDQWDFYICLTRKNRGASACPNRRFAAGELEAEVLRVLFDEVLTPENLARQGAAIANQREAELPLLVSRRRDLQAQLVRTNQAIERLVDSIEVSPASEILPARLMERERQRDSLTVEIAEIEAAIAAPVPKLDAARLRAELQETMNGVSPDAKRRLLTTMITRITVNPSGIEIEYREPFRQSFG